MEQRIRDFIHNIIPEADVMFDTDEFCVDIEEKIIHIGTNPDPEGDRLIQEFVLDEFGVAMDSFLIGVLHEVAHIITYDEKRNEEARYLYLILQMEYESDMHEEYSQRYFRIPSEYAATEWAVNYYQCFQEECDEFMDMIR